MKNKSSSFYKLLSISLPGGQIMVARRRKFRSFESLETRYTFAGDVTTSIDGSGNLLILGDNFANGLNFTETSTGRFDLTGINAGGSATNIDGVSNGTVHLSGVTGKITIRTLGGNDEVLFPYFNFAGNIIVNVGDGNDHIVLGDSGAASFLVGGLSIRTGEGIDEISEGNINVIGFHDFAATSTQGVQTPVGRHQELNIEGCTFGSLLYADFGGRRATLHITDVIVAGELDAYNGQPNFVGVDYLFVVGMSNVSVGGDLNVLHNTTSQITIEDATVIGKATFAKYLTNGTSHTLTISNSTLGEMSTDYRGNFDSQYLGTVFVTGNIDLKSNGSLSLTNVTATDGSLNSRVNTNSAVLVQGGAFQNLTLQSGDATQPIAQDGTLMSVAAVTVYQTLTVSPEGRLKTGNIPGPEGGTTKIDYNPTGAQIVISSSTIGTLSMPRAGFEPDIQTGFAAFGPAGSIDFRILSSIIQTVNIRLPHSDDELLFGNTLVLQSTTLDGGGFYPDNPPYSEAIGTGRNVLTVNDGSLANLTKTNFI